MLNDEISKKLFALSDEEIRYLCERYITSDAIGELRYKEGIQQDRTNDFVDSHKIFSSYNVIQVRRHPRFHSTSRHRHNFIEIVYMYRGSTTHIINGKDEVELREGNLMFIGLQTYHAIKEADFNDIAINIFIRPDFFDTLTKSNLDSPINSFLTSCMNNTTTNSPILLFDIKNLLPIQNILENILWYYLNPTGNYQLLEMNAHLLIAELQSHSETLLQLLPQDHNRTMVFQVLNYIETNLVTATLSEIAEELHQPSYRLSKLIHTQTGRTFSELVQDTRLNKAISLMQDTDLSINDIIREVGYSNNTYFYNLFNEKMGQTPAKFRKQWK